MTPPDANIEKQKRHHWPVLWGIVAAVALAAIGWVAYSSFVTVPDRTDAATEAIPTPAEDAASSGSGGTDDAADAGSDGQPAGATSGAVYE